jgi:hypothetical protein
MLQEEEEQESKKIDQTIYRNSPAFKRYEPVLEKVIAKVQDEEGIRNPCYNTDLAKDFLKKHISYSPLKIKFVWSYGYADPEEVKRPNNVPNERYNREIKDYFTQRGYSLGKIGIVDYVEELQIKLLDIDYKKVMMDFPSRQGPRLTRKTAKAGVEIAREKWGGVKQSSQFYNSHYLAYALGKEIILLP